jgi:hypothetical protein
MRKKPLYTQIVSTESRRKPLAVKVFYSLCYVGYNHRPVEGSGQPNEMPG